MPTEWWWWWWCWRRKRCQWEWQTHNSQSSKYFASQNSNYSIALNISLILFFFIHSIWLVYLWHCGWCLCVSFFHHIIAEVYVIHVIKIHAQNTSNVCVHQLNDGLAHFLHHFCQNEFSFCYFLTLLLLWHWHWCLLFKRLWNAIFSLTITKILKTFGSMFQHVQTQGSTLYRIKYIVDWKWSLYTSICMVLINWVGMWENPCV